MQRREQGVHRVPGVRVLSDLDIRDPADVDLRRPLMGDEPKSTPVFGQRELALVVSQRPPHAHQLAMRLGVPGYGDGPQVTVRFHHTDHRHLEADHIDHHIGDRIHGGLEVTVRVDPGDHPVDLTQRVRHRERLKSTHRADPLPCDGLPLPDHCHPVGSRSVSPPRREVTASCSACWGTPCIVVAQHRGEAP